VSDYKKEWFKILENHLQILSAREGVFTERKSGLNWRARYRRVHMVIYRKTNKVKAEALNAQVLRLTESLNEAGIHSRRMTGKDVWTWLMPWLSGEHEHAYSFMETLSYPEQQEANGELSETFDLGEMCLRNRSIQCSAEGKYWQLGNRYNRFITLEPYRGIPDTGHWVLEKQSGATSFDRMPDGAVLMYTLVIDPQDQVEAQVIGVKTTSIGDGEEAKQTRKECKQTLKLMAQDNRLISCLSGIYIDATSPKELEQRTTKAIAAAQGAGFDVIEPVGEHGDLLILDTFVRGLPMAFDPYLDQRYMKRARKIWDAHAARLLPLLTRGRGSNRHGISFNSAGGEPISFDPLGKDRSKNAHMLILGPTGSGKTTTLITILMQILATHNPRLYLITALPTFYLLGEFLEQYGKTVHRIQITESSQPSLPPFADITKIVTGSDGDPSNTAINDTDRALIGEAEIAARLMITQGDPKEEEHYRVEDKALMKQAIIFAAETVVAEGRNQALTEDIVTSLRTLAKNKEHYPSNSEREKLGKFATIMESYTTGMEGQLFNRAGTAWPEADITIVELGVLARKGYESKLAISMAGLMAMINHVVEKNQFTGRNTITVIDEGHILVKNPLIGPYLNSITAMWRTFGGWLWLSTQNLAQIPKSANELINQPEWWIGLCLDDDEVRRIEKFRTLSDDQKRLLSKTRKEIGKYTEGGLISTNLNTIFRIVPPPITLALAQTEPNEKKHRHSLMQEHGFTELEAVFYIADEIAEKRRRFGT
jgi:conjugative transfer ATPase